MINEKIDMRVKVTPPQGQVEVVKTKEFSKSLNLELDYDSQNISIIPLFKFSGKNKKINFKPSFVVYHRDLQKPVQVELLKTFDFKELLGIGMKGDFFLQEKFPEIDEFVNTPEMGNPSLRKLNDEKSNRKFADEVVFFTKLAFEINANNAFQTMEEFTPFLKGLMDYRSSFLSLIEYKGLSQIDLIKLGNANFLRISYIMQKPFDLIIPLIKGEGRVFKVEFDKKENLGIIRNRFYKFSLDETNWFDAKAPDTVQDTLTALQVVDFFSRLSLKADKLPADKAQALYGYYFEKSADVLRKADPVENEIWLRSVDAVFTIMEKMKDAIPAVAPTVSIDPTTGVIPEVAPVVEEDPRLKLFQNFQDLKNAIENKNKEFFGIQDSTNI